MQTSTDHLDWFKKFKTSDEFKAFKKAPVAYFCSEYALDSSLPTYAGGLGILSGDYIREIAKQDFPLLAVGLRYKQGQSILSKDGEKDQSKIKRVVDENNQDVIISLPMDHRNINIKAWQWEEGSAKVYLLDTDIEENNEADRNITKCLYDENRDTRLKQEIILGIGGFRLLARLGHHASVYHLNEGHSAFLALELIRHEMEHQHVNFKTACEYAQKHILFTNHTLALAGQEIFAPDRVEAYIDPCAKEICLNTAEIVGLGSSEAHPGIFSMTTFSFKLSVKSNAVSQIHYQKAKEVWPDEKMESITNGIFIERWDAIKDTTGQNISEIHIENKRKLLAKVLEKTGEVWSETDLILVWARRLVEYKQPLFILNNIERLLDIIKSSPVPVRIIFSGPVVTNDGIIEKEIKNLIAEKMQGHLIFLQDYNVDLAKILTSGADVWLNTPKIGFEACGTSGMKAALNGVLALSTNDGWISEVDSDDVGFVVNDSDNNEQMHTILKEQIIPMYYDYLKDPKNSIWLQKMTKARSLILDNFSTTRALRDYIEKLYLPIKAEKHIHKID